MLANPSTSTTLHYRPNSTHNPPFSHTNHRCKLSLSPYCPRFTNFAKSKCSSLSLLLSRRKRERLVTVVKAFEDTSAVNDGPQSLHQPISVKIPVGDRHVSIFYLIQILLLFREFWSLVLRHFLVEFAVFVSFFCFG